MVSLHKPAKRVLLKSGSPMFERSKTADVGTGAVAAPKPVDCFCVSPDTVGCFTEERNEEWTGQLGASGRGTNLEKKYFESY